MPSKGGWFEELLPEGAVARPWFGVPGSVEVVGSRCHWDGQGGETLSAHSTVGEKDHKHANN